MDRPLSIPVILGTPRRGRISARVAALIRDELAARDGIQTDLIDVRDLDLPTDDAGEDIKLEGLSGQMNRADGLVIVAPEYNHGYPGLLKHALDTNLKEYVHKAVGIAGVSSGSWGGTRVIENLLPVLRELGLVAIFWDVNFASVAGAFDEDGTLREEVYRRRIGKFLDELVWMATTLRWGRANVTVR